MKKIVILLLSITFFSCAEKEIEANYTEISVDVSNKTLSSGEEFVIKAISDLPLAYQSANDYNATVVSVNQWGNATVRAGYVGKTTIKIFNSENSKEVNLIISPRSNLFPTPPLNYFGSTKQEIISLFGIPDEETDTNIKYHNYSENAPFITYSFNNENRLYSITLAYKISIPFALNDYLTERYRFAGIFNDEVVGRGYVFHNSLNDIAPTVAVYVYGLNQEYDTVVYQPYIRIEEGTNSKISF